MWYMKKIMNIQIRIAPVLDKILDPQDRNQDRETVFCIETRSANKSDSFLLINFYLALVTHCTYIQRVHIMAFELHAITATASVVLSFVRSFFFSGSSSGTSGSSSATSGSFSSGSSGIVSLTS